MPPFLSFKNKKLLVKLTPLVQSANERTGLLADVAAGSSTITVQNINKFAINQILLIGELGGEQSEIIKTHGSTAPSGSTVTLASNLSFAHRAGTDVYIISFDQIELSRSATTTGSKTTLTTTAGSGIVSIEADEKEMVYSETEYTSGFYFARFKQSIAGTFGDYSDPVPYANSFDDSTVAAAIDFALQNSKAKQFDKDITPVWCRDQINDCLRYIQGKQKRWNKYQSLNTAIGTTARGTRKVAMPVDIYDPDSNRSLVGVRIGTDIDLIYKDPVEFEEVLQGLAETTVATQASSGSTSLVVTDSDDFEDSGSVDLYISGTKYTITYTGITRSTHTLTGIPASGTGSITVTLPVATNVFQGEQEGVPYYYTVRNGYIEYYYLPDARNDNQNIYADYWTEVSLVDSDADEIDAERYDMVKYWLTWKIRCMKKKDGKLDYEDGDYKMFADRLKDAIIFKGPLLKSPMKPKINGISYRGYGVSKRRSGNS